MPFLLETRLAEVWPPHVWYTAGTLIAVSGGPDSVALASALAACARRLPPGTPGRLVLAHYNHRLRGARSDADQQFVARLAEQLALPLCVGQQPQGPDADECLSALPLCVGQRPTPQAEPHRPAACSPLGGRQRTDIDTQAATSNERAELAVAADPSLHQDPTSRPCPSEAQLRRERYRFLLETANAHRLAYVAVGHTADDQAETILHRLLRGTGIHGLAGMPQSRSLGPHVTLVRPLLGFRRREVLEYLAQRGQAFCVDESNMEAGYTRNRLRRNLLPMLQAEYNPRVVEALLRIGEQAAQLAQWAHAMGAAAYARAVVEETPAGFTLDCEALAGEQPVVVREALMHGWRKLAWPEGSMTARHWNRLIRMVPAVPAARRYTLPQGITAVRRRGRLTLAREGRTPTSRPGRHRR